jgi:hypothetical protein
LIEGKDVCREVRGARCVEVPRDFVARGTQLLQTQRRPQSCRRRSAAEVLQPAAMLITVKMLFDQPRVSETVLTMRPTRLAGKV